MKGSEGSDREAGDDGRERDAAQIAEGARQSARGQAIALLTQAHRLDPANADLVFELAPLLARTGSRGPAVAMLDALIHARPEREAAARAHQFRIAPSAGAAWRYFRARLRRAALRSAGSG